MSAVEYADVVVPHKPVPLRAISGRAASSRWPKATFPIALLSMLAVGMIGQLLLQTKIQEQGFELAGLQNEAYELSAQQAILQAALDKQFTPQQLAYSASQLGMVANPYSTLLVLPTGEIIGSGAKVRGNEVPIISKAPTLPSNPTADDGVRDAMQVNPQTLGGQP
ncbi:MAG: cell division protein FtsL [Propionibacteriaceae bacterium]|nr:cell division protein FtsL [Propionibacteriaceae bacterium]